MYWVLQFARSAFLQFLGCENQLRIYDGASGYSKHLGNYCSTKVPTVIRSSKTQILVYANFPFGNYKPHFKIVWKAVPGILVDRESIALI